jgi:hypothetical protein
VKIRPFDFIKKINQPVINTGDVRLTAKTKKDAFLQKATEKSTEMLGKLNVDKKMVTEEAAKFFLKIPYVGPALKEATDATTTPNESKTAELEEVIKIKEALAKKRAQNAEGDKFQNFELNLDKQYISTDKKDAAFKTFVKNLKKELNTESNFIALKTIEFLNKHDIPLEVYPENATTEQIVQIKKEQNEKLSVDILKDKNLDDAYLCFMYHAMLENPDEIEKKILQDFVNKSFSKEEIKDAEIVYKQNEWSKLDVDAMAGKVTTYYLDGTRAKEVEIDLNDLKTQKLLASLIPDSEKLSTNLKSISKNEVENKDGLILREIREYRKKFEATSIDTYYERAANLIFPMLTGKTHEIWSMTSRPREHSKYLGTEVLPNDFKWNQSLEGPKTKKLLVALIYSLRTRYGSPSEFEENPPKDPKSIILEKIDEIIKNTHPVK